MLRASPAPRLPRIGALLATVLVASALSSCSSSTDLSALPGEVEIALDRNEYRLGDMIVITARNLGPGSVWPNREALMFPPCGWIRLERETETGEWDLVTWSNLGSAACFPGPPLNPPMPSGDQARFEVEVTTADELTQSSPGWAFEVGTSYRWNVDYHTSVSAETVEAHVAISPRFTVVP
jgi:hypothetical protein